MPTGEVGQEPKFRNLLLEHRGLATEKGSGTCVSSAVTISAYLGQITTEALTTTQNSIETIVLTNTKAAVGDMVFWNVGLGTSSAGTPMAGTATITANTITFTIINKHASAVALNGTLKIDFMLVKAL